jgi:formylglycine-generating enzyme required for sulfatase activity
MMIRNGEFVETGPDDFGPDILSRDVSDFIRRKARETKPFFVYYAEHLTHQPHTSMHDPEAADRETAPGMESNVRYVDFVIGQLVKTLKETGVWDNTVLMVSGDNPSDTLGKGFAAAIGAHVPLIIAGGKKWVMWQGETGCLTDFADVYPTCMELAGLNPATNPELSGKSLKPLLDGNKTHTRPWIFSYLGIHRMIRDRQWCLDGADQLWRCNESGNPFTFELITKEKQDAEATRGRAALEAILKGLPAMPVSRSATSRSGESQPTLKFQQLYRMGVDKLMAMPARKEGPTRAQIAARSGKSSAPTPPTPEPQPTAKPSPAFTAPTNMVFIPPGKFSMGSPKNEADRYPDEAPQMEVTISQGFWMAKYEVTQAEYLALMGTNPSHFTGDANRPVDSVSWSDATNYCARLTQRERAAGRIPTDLAYRLPTEAEWEYACRAGTTTRLHYGDDPGYTTTNEVTVGYSNLTQYAWYRQNAGFTTHPVGQKLPNPWGLYDMLGNVWEWCQDWYGAYPGGTVVDPQGPTQPGPNKQRTMRGGDYFNPAKHCRSALRGYDFIPKHPWPPDFGLRVVLAASQPATEVVAAPTLPIGIQPAPEPRAQNQLWTNSLGMKFVAVPGMPALFCIWETRVQDFEAFVSATGYDATKGMYSLGGDGYQHRGDTWKSPGFSQGPTHPVVGVSWEDARAFCQWLTEKERREGRLSARQRYRLPTDAEWSVAVGLQGETGGTPGLKSMKIKEVYPWGNQWPPPRGAGNFGGEESKDANLPQNFAFISGYNDAYPRTSPVGSFTANPFGLYDLSGNAWEWCEDFFNGESGVRVMRGGSWFLRNPETLLSSCRRRGAPDGRYCTIGFRVVRADDSVSQATAGGNLGKAGGGAGTVQERFNQMAITLGLSDEQKNKLMELQRAQYQQMGGPGGQSDLTPAQRMEQFKKFRAGLEQKVRESKILTDEQFAKWKEFQSQRSTGGAGAMPKRTNPAPEKPAPPQEQEPKPAVAPVSVAPVNQ